MYKDCDCEKLITSQKGLSGKDGVDGVDGVDGIIKWKDLNIDCLENNGIINEEDTEDEISQKLINFWCEGQQILFTSPVAYSDNYTTQVNTDLIFNPTLNDDYMGSIIVEIVTAPINGTAIVSNVNNKTITYTPNTNVIGNDSLTYKITDNLGQTSTAVINISIIPASLTACVNITASHIADLSVYNGKLKIQLVNTTDYDTNIPKLNGYLIEVRDETNAVLYSYAVNGNNNTIPQVYVTAQDITSSWDNIKITQTVSSESPSGQVCSDATSNQTYTIPNIQVSMYTDIDVSCLGVDSEENTDAEITQALVDKVCNISDSEIEHITMFISQDTIEISLYNYLSGKPGCYFASIPFGNIEPHFDVVSMAHRALSDNTIQVEYTGVVEIDYGSYGGTLYPDPIPSDHSMYNSQQVHGTYVFYYTNGIDFNKKIILTVINLEGKEWVYETPDVENNTWNLTGQDIFVLNNTYDLDVSPSATMRAWKIENYTLKVKFSLSISTDSPNKAISLLLPVIKPEHLHSSNLFLTYKGFGMDDKNAKMIIGNVGKDLINNRVYVALGYMDSVTGLESELIPSSVGTPGIYSYEIEIPLINPVIN